MHFHAGIDGADGRGAQVHQARRRKAQQNDAACQRAFGQAAAQHVRRRVVAKRPAPRSARAAIGRQRRAAGRERHLQRLPRPASCVRQPQALQQGRLARPLKRWRGQGLRRRLGHAAIQVLAHHGQRERFTPAAIDGGDQRHGAHDAVAIDQCVEKALRRGAGQLGDAGSVAIPEHEGGRVLRRQQRRDGRRQRAAAAALAGTGEVVAQHGGPALQGGGKARVAFFAAAPGFGKHGVKADDAGALAAQHFFHQLCHALARPGPLAEFGQAGLVHIHDNHAFVQRGGHEQAQPRVIQPLVGQRQQVRFMNAQRVQQGQRENGQRQGHAPEAVEGQAHGARLSAAKRRLRHAGEQAAGRREIRSCINSNGS